MKWVWQQVAASGSDIERKKSFFSYFFFFLSFSHPGSRLRCRLVFQRHGSPLPPSQPLFHFFSVPFLHSGSCSPPKGLLPSRFLLSKTDRKTDKRKKQTTNAPSERLPRALAPESRDGGRRSTSTTSEAARGGVAFSILRCRLVSQVFSSCFQAGALKRKRRTGGNNQKRVRKRRREEEEEEERRRRKKNERERKRKKKNEDRKKKDLKRESEQGAMTSPSQLRNERH